MIVIALILFLLFAKGVIKPENAFQALGSFFGAALSMGLIVALLVRKKETYTTQTKEMKR